MPDDNKDVFLQTKFATDEAVQSLEKLKRTLNSIDNAAKFPNLDKAINTVDKLTSSITKLSSLTTELERFNKFDFSNFNNQINNLAFSFRSIYSLEASTLSLKFNVENLNATFASLNRLDVTQLRDFGDYINDIVFSFSPMIEQAEKIKVFMDVIMGLPDFKTKIVEFSEAINDLNGPNVSQNLEKTAKGIKTLAKSLETITSADVNLIPVTDDINFLIDSLSDFQDTLGDFYKMQPPEGVEGSLWGYGRTAIKEDVDFTPIKLFHAAMTDFNNIARGVDGTKLLNTVNSIKEALGSMGEVTETEGFDIFLKKIGEANVSMSQYAVAFRETLIAIRAINKEFSSAKVFTSINKLTESISLLNKKITDQTLKNLTSLNSRFRTLSKISLRQVSNSLATLAEALDKIYNITNIKLVNLDDIVNFIKTFAEEIGPRLPTIVSSLENIDFAGFRKKMEDLSSALFPLQNYKSQAGGVINSLKNLSIIIRDLNVEAEQDYNKKSKKSFLGLKKRMEDLRDAFTPLEGLNIKLGATVKALGKIPYIASGLRELDQMTFSGMSVGGLVSKTGYTQFAENIISITDSLKPLENVKSRVGGTIKSLTIFNQAVKIVNETVTTIGKQGEQFTLFKKNITEIVTALAPLNNLGKSGFGSLVNQLAKLPKVMEEINNIDSAKFEQFLQRLERLNTILAPLANNMSKISMGINAASSKIGKLAVRLNETGTSANNATKGLFNFTRALNVGRLMSWYFFLRRIASVFSNFVTSSNDYVENLNLFKVSISSIADLNEDGTITMQEFNQATTEAVESARDLSDILGIDPSEFMRFRGVFQMIGSGFGMSGKNAGILSQNLTQLGYDLSSLYNIEIDAAMEKLQSGITGITRPLRELGIDLSEARLGEIALSMGIEKSVRSMTQAEKAELRYIALIQQTTSAQGDMARTLSSPANALRILKQQFDQLSRAMGNLLNPIMKQLVPYLVAFTKVTVRAINQLAEFFGYDPEDDGANYEHLLGNLSKDMSEFTDETEQAINSVSNLINGLDEFKTLSPREDEQIGGTLGVDLEEYAYNMLIQGMDETIANLEEKFTKFYERIVDQLRDLFGPFDELKEKVKDAFNLLMSASVANLAIKMIGSIGTSITSLGVIMTKVFSALKNPMTYLITLFIYMYISNEKFRTSINKLLMVAEDIIIKLVSPFSKLLDVLVELMSSALSPLIDLTTDLLEIFLALHEATDGVTTYILLGAIAANKFYNALLAVNIMTGVTSASTGILSKIFLTLKGSITTVISTLWVYIKTMVVEMINAIKKVIVALLTKIKVLWQTHSATMMAVGAIGLLFMAVLNLVSNWDKMSTGEKVVNVLLAVAAAATIAAIAFGAMNSAWTMGIAAVAIALGIAAITMSISRATKEAKQLGSEIQGYASGGVVDTKQLFYANEKGNPELVANIGGKTSVANNEMIVDAIEQAAYRGFTRAIEKNKQGGIKDEIIISVKGDDSALSRLITPGIVSEMKRTGYKLSKV